MLVFHVTERDNVPDIVANGFLPGWGDVGLGVYFYGNAYSAVEYAAKGGWDGELTDPVILQVDTEEVRLVAPHPSWDPGLYLDMWWKDMDDADEQTRWRPANVLIWNDPATLDPPVSSPRRRPGP